MADRLLAALQERGIESSSLVVEADARTVRKTRIMAGGPHGQKQQVLRLDDEDALPLTEKIENVLLQRLLAAIESADGVLLSDYGYGTLTPRVRAEAIEQARRLGIPVAADSRYELLEYRGITWATPNESEAKEAVRRLARGSFSLREIAERLRKELAAEFLLVTCGQDGMVVAEKNGAIHEIPIWGSAEAADVTGAGDTVAAAVLLAMAAGATPVDAAVLATVAAGIVVQKHGAATTSPEEIERVAGIRRKTARA
jgi:rfaE bifunctional protein kinase chain/domain